MDEVFEPKILINKDGLKMIRSEKSKFVITFVLENNYINLPEIMNFDLIKLIYDLNPDIYEKSILNKISPTEANIVMLMKHFFIDLGLPQKYSHMNIKKSIDSSGNIIFNCNSIKDSTPDEIPLEAEKIPILFANIFCNVVSNHKILFHYDISFNEGQIIPPFMEKFIGVILSKIFNRVKGFIENFRIN